jgi:hypothetical protein
MQDRRFDVTWVRKTDREEPWLAIGWLGGTDETGALWAMSLHDVIEAMWRGHEFFALAPTGVRHQVLVVRDGLHEYLVLEGDANLAAFFP